MSQRREAVEPGRKPAAPRMKRMEEWNVGPLWAWIAGAVVIVGLCVFAFSAMYESSHGGANAVPPPSSSAGATRDTDFATVPTAPAGGAAHHGD